jgi:NAD(P)-dependent dehydrogenase (short-subunit alcohol dehydrogenase family)
LTEASAGHAERRGAALVTGGAKRIGRAICLELAAAGFDLAIHHRESGDEAAQLAEAQRQFGGTQGIAQQNVDLRAQELQQEAQLQGRSLDLQAARDQATRELGQGQLGISQQEVDLRAQALVQQPALADQPGPAVHLHAIEQPQGDILV